MQIDEMIAVLQAAKEGKVIQCSDGTPWTDSERPLWDFYRFNYRVKPDPVVRCIQVGITLSGDLIYTPYTPNLELTFEEGVLVGAKVL